MKESRNISAATKAPLSPLDIAYMDGRNCRLYFYKNGLDPVRVKKGFEDAARLFPDVIGRLIRDTDGKYYILHNNAGINFEVKSSELRSEQIGDFGKIFDQNDSYGKSIPTNIVNVEEPMLNVCITHLADGAAILSIKITHGLCDGTGLSLFMSTWSRLATGKKPATAVDIDRSKLNTFCSDGRGKSSPAISPITKIQLFNKSERYKEEFVHKIFRLNSDRIARLKPELVKNLSPSEQWISTNDIVEAILVKSIAMARRHLDEIVVISSVNLRRCRDLNIDSGYFGNAAVGQVKAYGVKNLMNASITEVAQKLRQERIFALSKENVVEKLSELNNREIELDHVYESDLLLEDVVYKRVSINNVTELSSDSPDFGTGNPLRIDGLNYNVPGYVGLWRNEEGYIDVHLNFLRKEMKELEISLLENDYFTAYSP